MIAPDATIFDHLRRRLYAPKDAAFDQAVAAWSVLASDPAIFDREVALDFDREVALDAHNIKQTTVTQCLPRADRVANQQSRYNRNSSIRLTVAPSAE